MDKKQPINQNQIAALMRLKPTLKDTAAFFKCSEKTIERFIRDKHNLTFVDFRDQNMVHTRHGIIRKAIEKALAGDNTMLIFCLKNLCGWKDRYESDDIVTNNIQIKIDATDAKA